MAPKLVNLGAANAKMVAALTERLRAAMEDFVNEHAEEGVGYTDAFMAAHNFHKLVVLDLEERQGLSDQEKYHLRKTAVDTLRLYLLDR